MWDESWTKGISTEEDVKRIGETLVRLIKNNEGLYIGTLKEIGKEAGYEVDKNDRLENYGGIFNAIQEAKRRYNLTAKTKGKKGNEYTFKNNDDREEDNDSKRYLAIKTIIEITNVEAITGGEAIEIIKVLKSILK